MINTSDPDRPLTISEVAWICHEANRAYCQILGDYSQIGWGTAPMWVKTSAISGVIAILNAPSTTPEQCHQNWLHHKEQEGWSYGPTKDPEHKLHPCMLPYSQLPLSQRRKDLIFNGIVKSLMGHIVHHPSSSPEAV